MQALTETLILLTWLTPVSYDYSWNWGQQHSLLNMDKQVRYSVTVYPAGQRVFEIKHGKQVYFQEVVE